MKQTIEIEVPDGKKAILEGNKIVFKDVVLKLPKTWKEFCDTFNTPDDEYFIDNNSGIDIHGGGYRAYDFDKNLLPSKKAAEAHLALIQLHQLRDCYRQGWIPTNYNKRHCIVNSKQKYWITSELVVSCFLSFQSEEIAKQFLNNFKDLIKQAGDLI